jgi:hypothetical protein
MLRVVMLSVVAPQAELIVRRKIYGCFKGCNFLSEKNIKI